MVIEEYSAKDKGQVINLVKKILEEFNFKFDASLDADLFDIGNSYAKFLVLKEGSNIIGCVGINQKSKDIGELRRLYLAKEYRKKGWGQKLLKKAIEFCKDKNMRKIILDTTERNSRAIGLFSKFGFTETGRVGKSIFLEKVLK
jgi:N-acetylglutamate synthase-like GNAT family acetyltransferase